MAATLEHEVFSRYLNTNFRVLLGDSNSVAAELSEVSELRQSPTHEGFTIVFRGPREPLLNQAIYQFEHDEMGEFELFIVPIRQNEDSTFYEAVFNRMLSD
jgi:hypothetical protein